MKKVLLFLVDSMMPEVLERCVEKKKTPALCFLMEQGQYIADCATVFPTMTASIDCSLITGEYPDKHRIPGLVWYDSESKTIVNYINGTLPVSRLGIGHCAKNVLFDLNEHHLNPHVKTIHEELEERGLSSGSINVIAHRGHKRYSIQLPLSLRMAMNGLPSQMSGPSIFSLGTIVKPNIFRSAVWGFEQSALGSYGINDKYAIDTLIEVLRSGKQPAFTLVYMPDNDHKLHRAPSEAEEHLADVDKELVRFLNSYPSWQQAVQENVIIVLSDHGQTVVGTESSHNIDLEQLLADFQVHRLGEAVKETDEVIICNNERMAYLYPLGSETLPRMTKALAVDSRIDLIAWKDGDWIEVRQGGSERSMRFCKGNEMKDCYGIAWNWSGDPGVLDLQIRSGLIDYGEYPDALNRLYGGLHAREDQVVVVTASPGYEFVSDCSPTHLGGGSHGSLHRQDSLIPLLIVGAKERLSLPARLVDIKGFILQELGVHASTPVPV